MANLLVFSDETAVESIEGLCAAASDWILFPLMVDEKVIDLVANRLVDGGGHVESVVQTTVVLDQVASRIRDEYVHFIEGYTNKRLFGNKSVKEFFAHPYEGFSFWWSSSIFEKNNNKTESFHKLVMLVALINTCKESRVDTIHFFYDDRELLEALQGNAQTFGYQIISPVKLRKFRNTYLFVDSLLRACYTYIDICRKWVSYTRFNRFVKHKRNREGKSDLLIVTYFPLLDQDALAEGRFVNKYFVSLQNALKEREKETITWLTIPIEIDGHSWKDVLQIGEIFVENGYKFHFIYEWLRLRQLLAALLVFALIALKFVYGLSRIRRSFSFGAMDVEIWPIFRQSWISSFSGPGLFNAIIYYSLFKNILQSIDAERLLYLCENQFWEKAMCLSAKESKIIKVGIQHTSVPVFAMDLFFNSATRTQGNDLLNLPMPDYLACAGSIPARLHEKYGFPSNHIIEWGAVRYQHLKKYMECVTAWDERENIVVVTGGILFKECYELASWSHLAFAEDTDMMVIFKGHPACPFEPILADFSNTPDHFQISHEPVEHLLARAKALFVSRSTCAIEAIALQCPVIVPRFVSVVDMNPMREISDLQVYVNNVNQLRTVVVGFLRSSQSPLPTASCRKFVEDYFKFVSSDEEFLSTLP